MHFFIEIRDGVSGIFVTKNNKQFLLRSLWKKVCQLEKSTPPPVVAVVTNIRYGKRHEPRHTKWVKISSNALST